MGNVGLLKQTQQFLDLTVPGNQDVDAKVRHLIEAEHLRKLAQYRRIDLAMTHQYGIDFEEFIGHRIPRQENYSWEVEQAAMAWESAIGGIVTMERQLRELRGLNG